MKIVDVKGLCLNETNYSDTSKILHVLTEEFGLVGILSKGCRNLKSKLRGTSRKLLYGTYHFYYKEKGLSTLISIDLIESYPITSMDLEKIVYASFLLDLTNQVVKQCNSKGILSLVTSALKKIEEGLSPEVITSILQLKYLDYLGVSPMLDGCAVCNTTTNIVSASPTAGGLICKNCYQDDGYYSEDAIKHLRMYYYVDLNKITKIDVKENINKEINRFLDDYYDRYTGIYLKSKKVLQSAKKVIEK